MASAEEAWMDEAEFESQIAEELETLHDIEGDRAGSRYTSVSGRRRLDFAADDNTTAGQSSESAAPTNARIKMGPIAGDRRYVSASGGFPLSSAPSAAASSQRDSEPASYEVPFPSQPQQQTQPSSVENVAHQGAVVKRRRSLLDTRGAPAGHGAEDEDMDDLLALEESLAAGAPEPPTKRTYHKPAASQADGFDDLLDLEDELHDEQRPAVKLKLKPRRDNADEYDDLIDLEAELRSQAATTSGSRSQPKPRSGLEGRSQPAGRPAMSLDDGRRDDFDAMLGLEDEFNRERSSGGGGLRHVSRSQGDASRSKPTGPPHRGIASGGEPSSLGSAPLGEDRNSLAVSSDDETGPSDILIRAAAREKARRYLDVRRLQGRVFKRPPLAQSITVISTDGDNYVYVTTRTELEEQEKREKSKQSWSKASHAQLLAVPFHTLLQEVEDQRQQRATEEFDATMAALKDVTSPRERTHSASAAAETDFGFDDSDLGMDLDGDSGRKVLSPPPPREIDNQLWVEKYTPRSYLDLLSDDGTNRTLLAWLKLWDGVVFGRKVTAPPPSKEPGKSLTPGLEGCDDTGRPKQKVALLSGPPGLGKTTLAHVIAQHAGYRVMEINASDDRSPDILRQRIETATQNHSVIGGDQRPTCLIIDEIDGAQAAAINVLIAACGANKLRKTTSAAAAASGPGRKKKRGLAQGLSRPIICVCNDQYVPALRPLRQMALTLVFYPTQANKLANRLLKISRAEHLHADMTTLLALCEKAEKDIRSCLNTLQFLHRQNKPISLYTVRAASVGQKDAHKSLFELWQAIFQLPRAKRTRMQTNPDGTRLSRDKQASMNVLSMSNRFRNILSAAESTGEHDRVRQGLFENYLEMKFKDPSMESITTALEWFSDTDLLNHRLNVTQDYSFMKFLPFLPVVFHLLFATPNYPKLKYPHSFSENNVKLTHSQQIFTAILSETVPQVRQHFNLRRAVIDVLPPLTEIISPILRPVNTQLYNSKERQQLLALISNMISYNITYKQERQQDGQYQFVMDPNVEELVRYPGLAQKKQITYGGKQLIAREIEMEKMRRLEAAILGKASGGASASAPESTGESDKKSGASPPPDAPPVASKTPAEVTKEAREAKKKEAEAKKKFLSKNKPVKIAVDFFGRPIPPKQTVAADGTVTVAKADVGAALWFKFHEGFSNAVRKPVKIQDLL